MKEDFCPIQSDLSPFEVAEMDQDDYEFVGRYYSLSPITSPNTDRIRSGKVQKICNQKKRAKRNNKLGKKKGC